MPVWNYTNRRLVRFWSAGSGLDPTVIDALRSRRLDDLAVVEPAPGELAAQLREELTLTRRHLRGVLERYWDRGSRYSAERSYSSPEDALWRAAMALSEMQDALDELDVEG